MNPNQDNHQRLINEEINKLCQLTAENQQMTNYLNHIEINYLKVKEYTDKIQFSYPYKLWKKIGFFLYKPLKWYYRSLLVYDFFRWKTNQNSSNFDVLIFALIDYNFRHQRPQHLAVELTKRGHRVFYIEPDFINNSDGNSAYEPLIEKVQHNLYKVKLASKSKITKKTFVYYGEILPEDRSYLTNSVKWLIKKAGISQGVIKVDNPSWVFIVDKLDLPIIYDCIDDHGAFEVKTDNIWFSEESIIKKSDAISVVSTGYIKKIEKKYKAKNISVIENAGEYKHFAETLKNNISIPPDLKSVKPPMLGYCGAIAEWFDVNLLESIAKTFLSYSIVLIGSPDNSKVRELAQRYQNIHLLGEKGYRLLPRYYQKFSVCLIPFIINDVTRNLNPVKIYEYLATGKPIVTTNIPGLNQFNNFIYMSKDSEQFIQNIKKALAENNSQLSLKRQLFAKENTWEKRAIQLESIINQILK